MGGKGIKVALRIDAVGLFCPVPIVKLKIALEKLGPGEVIEILADDPGFPDDVLAWCRETRNPLLALTQKEEGVYLAHVEKA